ncbi:membrane or secreted protein [Flagellimonas iocasae]|uniref:Membrane or secreted protein n=1 Tax=Flagellimonas iocasae TaxID=2055905 RepID=A0ABW4XWM8_9FLAO
MKTILGIALALISFQFISAQGLQGAWERSTTNEEGIKIKHVAIIADGFFSEAFFEEPSGKFLGTMGGSFKTENNVFQRTYEFSTPNTELVGSKENFTLIIGGDQLRLGETTWTRVDDGSPGDLAGAWLISGRKQDGEIVKRDTSGPRKTMKILSGTRFQWIAFNTETKQFMGTGGGTYTTVDGKYTENIGFFSRDDSRVGASLEFNYELVDGDWHHSGLSSKGQPIYEVWSKRTP